MAPAKLEKRKATTLAYIEYKGPYNSIPFDRCIPRLYEWVKTKKIMPGFFPICVYHSDPKATPPEDCMTDIAITVKGNPKPEGDIKIRKLPAMTVATLSHKGPASKYQDSYKALTEFVRKKGCTMIGPPMEIYAKKPEMVDGQLTIYAKIMFPVRKS